MSLCVFEHCYMHHVYAVSVRFKNDRCPTRHLFTPVKLTMLTGCFVTVHSCTHKEINGSPNDVYIHHLAKLKLLLILKFILNTTRQEKGGELRPLWLSISWVKFWFNHQAGVGCDFLFYYSFLFNTTAKSFTVDG